MKIAFRLFSLILTATFALLPSRAALAQGWGPGGNTIAFWNDFILKSDETFSGNLVVLGGDVVVEENAVFDGDLIIVGGSIASNGVVNGDIVVFGGQADLDSRAIVRGDVMIVGGQLERSENANVEGQVINNDQPEAVLSNEKPISDLRTNWAFGFAWKVFRIFFSAVFTAGFGMLLALFWMPQIERAGETLVVQPLITGAVGLATILLGAALFVTIVPLIVVGFAFLFGMVALGVEVGGRLSRATNQNWSPVIVAGVGTFLLTLVGGGFGLIPYIGWIGQFLIVLLSVGAAIAALLKIRADRISPPPPISEP